MVTATPTRSSKTRAASRSSYFTSSRAHRYSILFALPLLLGYEALAAALAVPGKAELRNGADAMLRSAFTAIAGPYGALVFMAAIILLGVGLVARDLKLSEDRLQGRVFLGMVAESVALAGVFGIVIGIATAKLMGSFHSLAMSIGPIERTSWPTRLMLSLGAGLYEELFFRVLLVTGIAAGARIIFGFSKRFSAVLAAVSGALIFSAFHYIGPYGDELRLQSFLFRALSGLAFSGLYLLRGFGITAWTHALYDAFLLLA